jgi:hypothetical protein
MGLTFFIYLAVIFAVASTVTRNTLYADISVMQDVWPFDVLSDFRLICLRTLS